MSVIQRITEFKCSSNEFLIEFLLRRMRKVQYSKKKVGVV